MRQRTLSCLERLLQDELNPKAENNSMYGKVYRLPEKPILLESLTFDKRSDMSTQTCT
jgi:hypothetical protein